MSKATALFTALLIISSFGTTAVSAEGSNAVPHSYYVLLTQASVASMEQPLGAPLQETPFTPTFTPTRSFTPTATVTSTATQTPTSTPIPGDFSGDGEVENEDLLGMIQQFGNENPDQDFDLSSDGQNDFQDLFLFSRVWGEQQE